MTTTPGADAPTVREDPDATVSEPVAGVSSASGAGGDDFLDPPPAGPRGAFLPPAPGLPLRAFLWAASAEPPILAPVAVDPLALAPSSAASPPVAPEICGREGATGPGDRAARRPVRRPVRRRPRRPSPGLRWWHGLRPWLGLLLCGACLRALLRESSAPPVAGGASWAAWWQQLTSAGRPSGASSPWFSSTGTFVPGPAAPVVVLDPGHGGVDSGAVAFGVAEKDLTLDLALRVADGLRRQGVRVELTRTDDRTVPLSSRVRLANALARPVFVSIHFNHAHAGASGVETFYTSGRALPGDEGDPGPEFAGSGDEPPWRRAAWLAGTSLGQEPPRPAAPGPELWTVEQLPAQSQRLAERIQSCLVTRTASPNRGVKERSLFVTHRVRAPAVLVEGGFLSNPAEMRQLADGAYRQRLADSVVEGIVDYLREPPAP